MDCPDRGYDTLLSIARDAWLASLAMLSSGIRQPLGHRKGADMAAALGAIKGFLHFFTNDWARQEGSPDHIVTILDILEPSRRQG